MSFRFLPAVVLCLAAVNALPSHAADAQIPIAAFIHSDKFSQPRLSPDGKYLAIQVTQDLEGRDQKLLNVYSLDGFKLLSTIRFSVFQMPRTFYWVSNTRLIVSKAEDWGYLEIPVYLGEIFATDFDGQNQEYLYGKDRFAFQRRGSTSGGDDLGWGYVLGTPDQPNGRFFLLERKWERGRASSNHSFLYDVDATTGIRKLAADVGVKNLNYLLQHDNKPRFAFGFNEKLKPVVYLRDPDKDDWTPLPDEAIGSGFTPIQFTPDDQDFYLLLSETGGPNVLMRQSMRSGVRTLVAKDSAGDINMIQFGPGMTQPFAVASELGVPTIRYIDDSSSETQLHKALSKQFPGQYVNFVTFSVDGNKLLFTVSSDKEPGEFYLFDRKTKKAEFLVAVRPDVDASRMAERKPIRFKARDGLELHGYLTLPPNMSEKKPPLVLLANGSPEGFASRWFFDTDAQFLASRGYAVLQVNSRGSGGRGVNFIHAGDHQWATGMQQDLIDGVRWVTAQNIADPARVCVYGGSFGGYSAMMTIILEPDMFKCAVSYAGFYDLSTLLTGESAKHSVRVFNFLATAMGTDLESLKNESPAYLVDKIKVPVLLVHGDQDKTTPPAQAEAMRAALTKANKPFEWMMVAKEGHGFYAEKNRLAFYEKLEAFLAKHLAP